MRIKIQAFGLGLGFRPRIALDAHDEDALKNAMKMRVNVAKRCCVAQVRTYDFGDSSLHGSLVRSHSADHMKRRKDGSLGLALPHPLLAILWHACSACLRTWQTGSMQLFLSHFFGPLLLGHHELATLVPMLLQCHPALLFG